MRRQVYKKTSKIDLVLVQFFTSELETVKRMRRADISVAKFDCN